jgi:3-methyladenine DNA glycosylase AlkD
MSSMDAHLNEVQKTLKKTSPKNDKAYVDFRTKTSNLNVLGHRLPLMHQIVKDGFSFYEKSDREILKVWDNIWNTSQYHEALYLPLFYYRHRESLLGPRQWRIIKHWIDRIENWEHADALCYLYSILFERYPNIILPTLKKWNRSDDPWKQRCSIVSLIYYASPKHKPPTAELVLNMVKPLMGSQNTYVNKAVGWTLRECYNLYPKSTLIFIKKHITELSPDGFSYATEKLDKETKTKLKTKRALARKQYRPLQKSMRFA